MRTHAPIAWARVLAIVSLWSPAHASLQDCLKDVCAGASDCVRFAHQGIDIFNTYQHNWVRPYNLAVDVTPEAVIRPRSAQEVAAAVRCAAQNGYKVQARSGGHSYANFGLGDGAVTIDLVNINKFSVDKNTGYVTLGSGLKLGDIDEKLRGTGLTFPHGACPGVGGGGHFTVAGIGSMSRMWGLALDHIVQVEAVTADGSIVRASEQQNSELFFAIRGAAASVAVVTEFVMRTHPEPGNVVQYIFELTIGEEPERLASVYMQWYNLITDPALDRRFGSEIVIFLGGIVITGTFYGTQAEFDATGIQARLPGNGSISVTDWLGSLTATAQREGLYLSNLPSNFYSKSLAFRPGDVLTEEDVLALFRYTKAADKGTPVWFIIFDVTGGAIADVPGNATAYGHRPTVHFYQSYAVGVLSLSDTTRKFLTGFHEQLVSKLPPTDKVRGAYPGYVDLGMSGNPQEQYWMENLPALQRIKAKWDPSDVFHNPQSVRPAGA